MFSVSITGIVPPIIEDIRLIVPLVMVVHGGFAAVNRGADFVKYLIPSLRLPIRYLTRHRAQCRQASLARTAHGAGQHRDYKQAKKFYFNLTSGRYKQIKGIEWPDSLI